MVEIFWMIVVITIVDAVTIMSEAALLAVPRSRVLAAKNAGKEGADALEKLKTQIHRPLAALTIFSNFITIVGAFVVGVVASHRFGGIVTGIASALLTIVVIAFGEILPKTIGERYSEFLARTLSGYISALTEFLGPLIKGAESFTRFVTRAKKTSEVSEEEISAMTALGEESGAIGADEAAMIRRVFLLNDVTARDLMTPRNKVFYLNGERTLEESKEKILNAKHSRIPIVSGEILDKVLGVAHQRDLLIALDRGEGQKLVKAFAKKPLCVPKQLRADELIREFQKRKTHLAIVRNEHGEVSGVVALEDCLEELVGEIIDEKDVVPDLIKRISKDEIVVHGETKCRYINSLFQTTLPETKTILDFLQQEFRRVPEKGNVFTWKDLEVRIEEGSNGEVNLIRITRKVPLAT